MLVRLSIDKAKVLEAVGRQTEYDAVKTSTEESSSVGTLPVTSGDGGLMEDYWKASAAALTARIGRYLEDVREDALWDAVPGLMPWRGYDAMIRVPGSWPRGLQGALNQAGESYMTQAILGRWYQTNGLGEQATVTMETAAAELERVVEVISKRR
jgi:hypothetical protein